MLVRLSRSSFRGEEERQNGLRCVLNELASDRRVHEVTDTDGLDATMLTAASAGLESLPGK